MAINFDDKSVLSYENFSSIHKDKSRTRSATVNIQATQHSWRDE